jgi:hypothetical protein
MSEDLRKQRMESSEGRGRARRLWDSYAEAANRIRPAAIDRAGQRLAATWSADLLGFWLSWHLYGGFEGLERAGWHRATIYRKLKVFRMVFKKHPDEYQVAGVILDPRAFWDAYLKPGDGGGG